MGSRLVTVPGYRPLLPSAYTPLLNYNFVNLLKIVIDFFFYTYIRFCHNSYSSKCYVVFLGNGILGRGKIVPRSTSDWSLITSSVQETRSLIQLFFFHSSLDGDVSRGLVIISVVFLVNGWLV